MKEKKITKTSPKDLLPKSYPELLKVLKDHIQKTQLRAAFTVNLELIKLYWSIGKAIVEKQKKEKWGTKIIEKLGRDLQKAFPGIQGFSRANIFYMRSFYFAYEKVQQPVGQFENLPIFHIPWGHNVILISRLKENSKRLWYAKKSSKMDGVVPCWRCGSKMTYAKGREKP